jgi:hypothetical protein
VQDGKANFSLTLTATFSPSCSPPMTVRWSDLTVTDETIGISVSFPGPIYLRIALSRLPIAA